MWSRSNPPAASATAISGRSWTTSPTRSAVCRSGTTIPPNAAITLNLEAADGPHPFGRLAATSDVILETFRPGFLASLGLDYESLRKQNSRLIMCALTPFGQTGPWRDYLSSDLLHMAAGGEMASSGYDEADVPNAPPVAPGGGNAWHMGCHFAYMAIMAALVYRTVAGQG
jgi:crotonobetainyl-CoA:carnitine CoA-transferase CaiB-like acyl-CoA transferase